MEDEHFVDESTILSLATVHDHTLLEHSRAMVLSRDGRETFGGEDVLGSLSEIED